MKYPTTSLLRIGDWCANPMTGELSRVGETVRVEARTMRLLSHLAERPGEVVSIDDLLNVVWSGVIVTPDSVYQAVTSLRRLLGDDPKRPTYIATVPRIGYRLIAKVDSWIDAPETSLDPAPSAIDEPIALPSDSASKTGLRFTTRALLVAGAALLVACVVSYWLIVRYSAKPIATAAANSIRNPKSIAVLPFLDLTDGMKEEYFADGMTEELIDKLSKIPGLRVPSPTSSFYFKGKQMTVADIAKSLSVVYVLDGSVRKSDDTLRIAARLIRADDGFVVWSETYDRPLDDKLMVQDDIAGEVTKALRTSLD